MSDVFSPAALNAAIQKAVAADDTGLTSGNTRAFVTAFDGHSVSAAYVQKVGEHWTVKTAIDWHGGTPDVGVQVHASW